MGEFSGRLERVLLGAQKGSFGCPLVGDVDVTSEDLFIFIGIERIFR